MSRLALLLVTGVLAAPAAAQRPPPDPAGAPYSALRVDAHAPPVPGAVRVIVDPRVELMSVIQLLSGYPILTKLEPEYRRRALERFRPWERHRAVELFREMGNRGFAYDAVPKVMIALSDPPLLIFRSEVPEDVVRRAGGEKRLEAFVQAAREFALESDFAGFFEEQRPLYEGIVSATAADAAVAVAALRDYLGMELGQAVLVLGPLLHDGGFAALQSRPAGGALAWAFIGPQSVREGLPHFGSPGRVGSTLWHELAHTVVNPLTEAAGERVDALQPLHETIREAMRRHAYADWETVVSEHVIRALTSRVLAAEVGEEAAAAALSNEEARGFVYVRPLAERLARWEAEGRPASFPDLYPDLLGALEGAAPRR